MAHATATGLHVEVYESFVARFRPPVSGFAFIFRIIVEDFEGVTVRVIEIRWCEVIGTEGARSERAFDSLPLGVWRAGRSRAVAGSTCTRVRKEN